MNNPKTTISAIISLLLLANQLLTDSAEVIGMNSKTLAIISLIITFISLAWKQVRPDESLFTLVARHIGTRPKKPRG